MFNRHEFKQGSCYNNAVTDTCVKCGLPQSAHRIYIDFAGKRFYFNSEAEMQTAGFYFVGKAYENVS